MNEHDRKHFQLVGEIDYLVYELSKIRDWLKEYAKKKDTRSPIELLVDQSVGESVELQLKFREAKTIVRKIRYRQKKLELLQ